MYAYTSESEFAAAGPAATALLKHFHDEFGAGHWVFERGTASSNGTDGAWCEYSAPGLVNGSKRDILSLLTHAGGDGGWKITATVTRATT